MRYFILLIFICSFVIAQEPDLEKSYDSMLDNKFKELEELKRSKFALPEHIIIMERFFFGNILLFMNFVMRKFT